MSQEIYAIRTSGNGPHARYEAHLCSGRQWHDSPVRVYLKFEIPKFERMGNPIDQKFERFEIPIEPKAFIDMACAMMKAIRRRRSGHSAKLYRTSKFQCRMESRPSQLVASLFGLLRGAWHGAGIIQTEGDA
jgi:hypothetical protein